MPPRPNEGQRPASGNALNPSRKFVVRLSIATGATFATLVGAQALAIMDTPKPGFLPTPQPTTQVDLQQPTILPAATLTLPSAAPQIVIVRNAGTPAAHRATIPRRVAPAQQNAAPPVAVAPPVHVAPAPVQPNPPSRSSR
jgi:hypothetical protein